MYEIDIEWADGSSERLHLDDWQEVQNELNEFKDQPVRIWVDGDMVQCGFVAWDDLGTILSA